MASLISKKKGNKLYYYVVESARVDGQPRIVQQTYLGTAEKVAALLKDRTAPVPVSASRCEFGLPGALWLAAQRSGMWDLLRSMWPKPKSGPSPAHYLLLAAIHRICQPGPKTEVADWYRETILQTQWQFPPDRFSSQAFWDCFDQIQANGDSDDELDEAQRQLVGVWKEKQLVSRRLLAYDTTNFYTWVASTNQRNRLAQRGHNKQGRHNLRQIGMSYVLDAEHGLSLCHHVYAGNVADAVELPEALNRIVTMLDRNQIERQSVTLVFDKGTAALENTLLLEKAEVGWISALPWNQAPPELRERDAEQLPACGSDLPGVRAAAEKAIVHGKEYLCVLKYSSSFASEQLHSVTTSLTTSLTKVLQSMRRLSLDLAKPGCRLKEDQIRKKIQRWLLNPFLEDLIRWQLHSEAGHWRLQFDFDNGAFLKLLANRLGRTLLLTNRMDWTAEQVVAGYSDQQQIEQVFRGLKDGDWLGWGPMYHWTDSKIRVHAFYCMLGISMLKYIHRQAQPAWPGLSMENLLDELRQIQQFVLLYPPQGEKGPHRAAVVLSKQTIPQQQLARVLGLDQLRITPKVGNTNPNA